MRQEPTRIYVAGRFTRYEHVRAFMDALTNAGYVITHDWTRTEAFGDDGHPLNAVETDLPQAELAMHAEDDVRGCRTADLVVVLANEPLCGALIELGVALAVGVPIWVVAPWRWTVFWEHPLVTLFDNQDDVLKELVND